jgi:hypothetical protein
MSGSGHGGDELLGARMRLPEHVVYRNFGEETVVLNLDTGMYHGLNRTAALMLDLLTGSETVAEAVERAMSELGQRREVIERDLLGLCRTLGDRGLIERHGGGES